MSAVVLVKQTHLVIIWYIILFLDVYKSLSMASNDQVCRLCRDLVHAKRAIHLFSTTKIPNERVSWITALLEVSISRDDGLTSYICLKCELRICLLRNLLQTYTSNWLVALNI